MRQLKLSFDFVSQTAHVGWGFILTVFPVLVLHKHFGWEHLLEISAGIVIAGAAIKECWDCHGLEDLATAGDSLEDFSFWCAGVAWGALGIIISFR